MKKLLVVIFVMVATQSFGQGLIQNVFDRLTFGVKAGANYSNYVNADFNTDPLTGFHAGAIVNFRLTNHLSIQEEFLFSSQGAKTTKDMKIYYGSVPILLKYRTNLGLYAEAGAVTNMRLHEDTPGFAKQLDFGAAGGIGYQSNMGLGFGVRYVAGLSKAGMICDFRSSVVQGSIFYIF